MSWPAWLPLRTELKDMSAYGAPQVPAHAILNTNENPYAPSPQLQAALTEAISEVAGTLNRYPDRDAIKVRAGLASYVNERSSTSFEVENIWAANGSNEIIQSIFLACGAGVALGFTPSYSMHPLIAKVAGTSWINGERNSDFTFNLEKALHHNL